MVRARIRRKEILELGHRPIGITIRDSSEPEWHVIIGGRNAASGQFEVDLQSGVEKVTEAGQMAFVPAGTAHEAWKPFDAPAEFIILMFGDGA